MALLGEKINGDKAAALGLAEGSVDAAAMRKLPTVTRASFVSAAAREASWIARSSTAHALRRPWVQPGPGPPRATS